MKLLKNILLTLFTVVLATCGTAPAYAKNIFSYNSTEVRGTNNSDTIFSYNPSNVVIIGCGGNDDLSGGLNSTIQRLYANRGPNGECSNNPGEDDVINLGDKDIGTGAKLYVMHGFNYDIGARIDTFRRDFSKVLFPLPIWNRIVMSSVTTENWREVQGGYRVDVVGIFLEIPGFTTTREEGVGVKVLVKWEQAPISIFVPNGTSALMHPTVQALKAKVLASG